MYVVKTHDTLWDIAATHLGNPDRWSELFDLNRGRAEPGGSLVDPNLIYRGWTLDFPTHGANLSPKPAMQPSRETLYVVQPGDTLWGLAATHLGNPDRWSELFDLNRGRAEPGGQLVSPNLIYAGWTLEFPAGATGLSPHTTSTGTVSAQEPIQSAAVLSSTVIAGVAHVTTHGSVFSEAGGPFERGTPGVPIWPVPIPTYSRPRCPQQLGSAGRAPARSECRRIVVSGSSTTIVEALGTALAAQPGLEVLCTVTTEAEMFDVICRRRPDGVVFYVPRLDTDAYAPSTGSRNRTRSCGW